MKIPQLAGVIVTSMVVILMVVSVLMPIIQESDTTHYVESQNTDEEYRLKMGDATLSQKATLTAIDEGSATYTIGTATTTLTDEYSLVWIWDNGIVRATSEGFFVKSANVSYAVTKMNEVGDYIEFNGAGLMSSRHDVGTEQEAGRTSPYTWALVPDSSGEWGYFDGAFNVSTAQKFYAVFTPGALYLIAGYGTATSMEQIAGTSSESSTWQVERTQSGTYYNVTGCNASITVSGNTGSGTAFCMIAPLDYISSADEGIVKTLLDIIPILIIVGVVMAVVGIYFKGRDY